MRRIRKMLKNGKKGEGYIETVIFVFVATALIVFSVNVFQLFSLRSDLDQYAKQVLETASVTGSLGSETMQRIDELSEQSGLHPDISFEGTVFWTEGSDRIQYGEPIRVTVSVRSELSGFGLLSLPVTLKASAGGLSRRYWK